MTWWLQASGKKEEKLYIPFSLFFNRLFFSLLRAPQQSAGL
jgi:hypothetical protein